MCGDLLEPLLRRYKSAGGRDDADVVREISTWSLAGWLEHQQASARDLAMARTVRGFFLADPEDLSVLPMVAQLAAAGSPARIPVLRIVGGTDRLVDALVAHTSARILLRHQVRGIEQTDGGIVVRVSDERDSLQEIACDAVVIAMPASTLRDITITPPLPDEQRKAIARLRYGCATKVAVQIADDALRRRRGRAFATDSALGAFWDATEGQPSDARSVVHFVAGGSASARLREKARHGAGAVLADLCWLGLAGAPIVASHQVSWEDDPLARGGYAYADPGFDPAWKPLLSRRAGNIVFAGEHTSHGYQGYMEGAVESGQRAAGELMG
jgi:monoamine oxidase